MSEVVFIFPHQLFKKSQLPIESRPVYLIEETLFFNQFNFHKQKLWYHRTSMKRYANFLIKKGVAVNYVEAIDENHDVRKLIQYLGKSEVDIIHYIDPTDNWLEQRIEKAACTAGIKTQRYENPSFINVRSELNDFFKKEKKKFFQTKFYINERKKRKILVDEALNPAGGKWSFDAENRKKYPKGKTPPAVQFPAIDSYHEDAKKYVEATFPNNTGEVNIAINYPSSFQETEAWLHQFFEFRFHEFGVYEDAMVDDQSFLNHSILTPMLNTGLIKPLEIIDRAIYYAEKNNVPINSLEGFVRQIMGWREFIRGIYECKGSEERTKNYWGFERKIPASFYDGTTGIEPVDLVIKKTLKTGYCHHIERLMVLGNFMLLCEFDPDEVYRWFMELFIDAYDWVMVTNVYGMSQFADGGLMSTKPYISGSNYLIKMSNFKKGDWQKTWDGLFWRFMHVHRDFFLKNPRLGMLVRTFDKMDAEKKKLHLSNADAFIASLD